MTKTTTAMLKESGRLQAMATCLWFEAYNRDNPYCLFGVQRELIVQRLRDSRHSIDSIEPEWFDEWGIDHNLIKHLIKGG